MIIDCVSDLHGHLPEVEDGDVLIIAGDCTARDDEKGWKKFIEWSQILLEYDKIILVGGNHDNSLQKGILDLTPSIDHYLCDSGIEYEGLKIWGSPWTSRFPGINPHCCAFTGENDEEIAKYWDLIPTDTDILITHSPPFTIRDMTTSGHQVGSPSLMAHHISRLRPKLWVFGHIHEGYGQEGPYQWNGTKYVNASHVNERYQPVNKPIRIIL